MGHSNVVQIVNAEERLRLAILQSDVAVLDELLAAELIFTNHLGQIMGKQEDLDAHRSATLKVQEILPSEQNIQYLGDVAIVNVKVHIVGSYAGTKSASDFRFTRVWRQVSSGNWQVVAAHSCVVA